MSAAPKKAVVLLSGGLDSTTVLAIAKEQGYSPLGITFEYGQRHAAELKAAAMVATVMKVPFPKVVQLDLRAFGGSALTADIDVPKDRDGVEIGEGIPITYVPARNTIFLSYALAYAEVSGAQDIFLGVNALDYSGYPDCRPEFIAAFEALANLATKSGVEGHEPIRLHAPLSAMTKADIVREGTRLGVDYGLTLSCYDPADDQTHCGRCDACALRKKGFVEAGISDPTRYAA